MNSYALGIVTANFAILGLGIYMIYAARKMQKKPNRGLPRTIAMVALYVIGVLFILALLSSLGRAGQQ